MRPWLAEQPLNNDDGHTNIQRLSGSRWLIIFIHSYPGSAVLVHMVVLSVRCLHSRRECGPRCAFGGRSALRGAYRCCASPLAAGSSTWSCLATLPASSSLQTRPQLSPPLFSTIPHAPCQTLQFSVVLV